MPDDAIESRLTRLEQDSRELRDTQNKIFDLLREVRDAQIRTSEKQNSFSERDSDVKLDIKDIKEGYKELDGRIRVLESDKSKVEGAGWSLKIFWALISAGLVALGAFLKDLLLFKK